MMDITKYEPRTVYVRLGSKRFFDDHEFIAIDDRINEMPQMSDSGHATKLFIIQKDQIAD